MSGEFHKRVCNKVPSIKPRGSCVSHNVEVPLMMCFARMSLYFNYNLVYMPKIIMEFQLQQNNHRNHVCH